MNVVKPQGGEEYLRSMAARFRWGVRAHRGQDYWSLTIRIPFSSLGLRPATRRPIRMNIIRYAGDAEHREIHSVVEPANPRAVGYGEPDFGWLVFA
jgi:hypothetical protein